VVLAGSPFLLTTSRSSDQVLIGVVDTNNVVVSSRIAGRIERLNVEEGSIVKQGDLVAIIDSRELLAEKTAAVATIGGLRQRVKQARSQAVQARGETESQLENARVRVQAARSAETQAKAELERIRSDAQRLIELAQQGVASQADKERARAQLQSADAALQIATEQVRAAEADVNTYEARLQQASAAESTVLAAEQDVRTAQANLAQAETRLGYAQILAPVSGQVNVRASREGEVVNAGQAIVTIVDFTDTWVFAALPETQAGEVAVGSGLTVQLPWGERVPGKVIYKAAEADFATQRDVSHRKRDIKTVAIKVRIDNQNGRLVPGMTANVLIPASHIEGY